MPDYKRGYLSDFFEGFAVKRLTAVEVNPEKSNQHEFQGIGMLRKILGTPEDKITFNARFIWLEEEKKDTLDSYVTWSDVRRNQPNRSPEYHLYYSAESADIVHRASPNDLLVICKQRDGNLLVILTPAGATIERQLSWLFDFSLDQEKPLFKELEKGQGQEIGFAARFILDELGIEAETPDENWLEILIKEFGEKFPTTSEFSKFSRKTLKDVSVLDNPDQTLMAWMDHEEKLFRTLEAHIIGKRLKDGFYDSKGPDVEGFIKFSLTVQNSRKSRAGHALENHLEEIFNQRKLRFSKGKATEQKKKPDFLFPGVAEYHAADFPIERLTLLGAKSTCKDRWRQVLTEGAKIRNKHLLTLEPGISENQTAEMQAERLQLVVPQGLHTSYTSKQQQWLWSMQSFLKMVEDRQGS